ncbi:MAG TPA: hypothetical protein VLO12_04405 [Halomonas sp.]|nr:hypothetical protein [Halomonas sp.]
MSVPPASGPQPLRPEHLAIASRLNDSLSARQPRIRCRLMTAERQLFLEQGNGQG